MDLNIQGKTALIGASSQGLGKAVALELAREGANIVLCARNADHLQAAKQDIESAATTGTVLAVPADLAKAEARDQVITTALDAFGTVDILVTNTGGPPAGLFEEHSEQAWDDAYQLLLASTASMIRAVLPGMKAQHWGRIITITSMAVKQPVESLVLSNSIRAGVVGLVRTLANEVGQYGITVNNVMPGYTNTQRLKNLVNANASFLNTDSIPLRRVAEPDEFAAAVAFLASARASYITGASIPVDGGWIKSLL